MKVTRITKTTTQTICIAQEIKGDSNTEIENVQFEGYLAMQYSDNLFPVPWRKLILYKPNHPNYLQLMEIMYIV